MASSSSPRRTISCAILISGRAEISIVVVFVGVLGGLAAFGLVGLFVGPVILSLALALIEGDPGEAPSKEKPATG